MSEFVFTVFGQLLKCFFPKLAQIFFNEYEPAQVSP